jgi:hypothetical protein
VIAGPTIAAATGGGATPWLTVESAGRALFPGVPATAAAGLVIAFAFLQAIHYAIWLVWLPNDLRARPAGPLPALAVAAATLVVVGAAVVADPAWARTTYLALATFHIYLELVVLGLWLARRGASR